MYGKLPVWNAISLPLAAVRDDNGKLYPSLAQIAVREAKYLSNLIPKHFIANGDADATPLSTDEKFEYTIKVQLISLGNDEYVGFFNNHVISGNLARLLEEFSMSAYIKNAQERRKRYHEYEFIWRWHIFPPSIWNNFCTFYFCKMVKRKNIV